MTDQPIKLCKDCKHYVDIGGCALGQVDFISGGRATRNAQAARENWMACGLPAHDFEPIVTEAREGLKMLLQMAKGNVAFHEKALQCIGACQCPDDQTEMMVADLMAKLRAGLSAAHKDGARYSAMLAQ